MSEHLSMEDFVTDWIYTRLKPNKKSDILTGHMSKWVLQQSIRTVIVNRSLFDQYSVKSWREILIDDTTLRGLVEKVADRIAELCKAS